MNELVSVGGICFVAGTPESAESANLRTNTDGYGRERIGTDPASPEGYAVASGEEADGAARASGTGKRKYRPRGSRTRKEQQKEASRRYYLEHRNERLAKAKTWRLANMEKFRDTQRKYRETHKEEIARNSREYYQVNREKISRKAHLAYLRRKEHNETAQRTP